MDRLHGFFSRSLGVLVLVIGLLPLCAQATLVRIQTVRGPLDIALTDSATPKTVAVLNLASDELRQIVVNVR